MRARVILVSIAATAAAAIGAGCMAPLLEPLEPQLVFRPRALAGEHVKALAGTAASRKCGSRPPTASGSTAGSSAPSAGRRASPSAGHRLRRRRPGDLGVRERRSWSARLGLADDQLPRLRPVGGLALRAHGARDAKVVYDWALARPDIDAANIVVLGRSLGSYVAIAVAAARKVRGRDPGDALRQRCGARRRALPAAARLAGAEPLQPRADGADGVGAGALPPRREG